MNPQIPNIAVIASSVAILLSLAGVTVLPAEIEKVVGALLVVLIAAGGVWSWFETKFLSNRVASMSAQLGAVKSAKLGVKARAKKKKSKA